MKLDTLLPYYKGLNETHHKYNNPTPDTKFDPVKEGDTFTVYHGFNSLGDAIHAAQDGLTGKSRAPRRYSYEADNNPEGLFITLSLDVAKEFSGSYHAHAVIEFTATYSDLESPVWPGGSYTVQGQMSQSFGVFGSENRRARSARRKKAEGEVNSDLAHVNQSDQKYLANLLTNTTEYQALFRGNLNPNQIDAFWVRPADGMDPKFDKDDKWERVSVSEFLERYGGQEGKFEKKGHYRVFKANDKFDGEEYLRRLDAEHGGKNLADNGTKYMWKRVIDSKNKKQAFIEMFGKYLWPKQYKDAYRWFYRRYNET